MLYPCWFTKLITDYSRWKSRKASLRDSIKSEKSEWNRLQEKIMASAKMGETNCVQTGYSSTTVRNFSNRLSKAGYNVSIIESGTYYALSVKWVGDIPTSVKFHGGKVMKKVFGALSSFGFGFLVVAIPLTIMLDSVFLIIVSRSRYQTPYYDDSYVRHPFQNIVLSFYPSREYVTTNACNTQEWHCKEVDFRGKQFWTILSQKEIK